MLSAIGTTITPVPDSGVQEDQPLLGPVNDVRVKEEQRFDQKMMLDYKRNNH